jgi:hypothetical protein
MPILYRYERFVMFKDETKMFESANKQMPEKQLQLI